MKRLIALVGSLVLAFSAIAAPAFAAPLAYYNQPIDSVQNALNTIVTAINAGIPTASTLQTATGSAGASTLNGVKGTITTESLSTAASTTYTETLTNSSIAANSIVLVTVGAGTSTTGQATVAQVTPGAGSATIKIQNASTSAALNGTLTISFLVVN